MDLVIVDEDTGLGGRYLAQFIKRNRSPLPWTRLNVGSPVVLSPQDSKEPTHYRGVVYQRSEGSLHVAIGSAPDDLDEHELWRLDLSSDEVAVQRQRTALERARLARGDRLAELRDVLLGQRQPTFAPEQDEPPLDSGLNDTQRAAVRFALAARDVALIHGPPGTGKTTAVAELIRRAVRRGEKVLACAPSNLAVDNIFERLLAAGERAVRLGHPARVLPQLRAHTLDLLVDQHPDVRLARKLVKEAMGLFRRASRYTRAKPLPGARQEARQEAKNLLADARRLESQAVEHILDTADIVCTTTTGLDSDLVGARRFRLGRDRPKLARAPSRAAGFPCYGATGSCWPATTANCRRTVVSQEAAAEGFGVSLFERLMALHGTSIARRLTVQYRMHQAIMDFPSLEFYENELEADATVRDHLLADLPSVLTIPSTQSPVEFIDTAGAGFDEEIEPDGESRLNPQEAALVCRKVQGLLDAGVAAGDIAVIAPYAAQVRLLRERLSMDGLEIDSVDGFQGREKEAVIISLVRSNPKGEIGFLGDVRRMNVAMTRARRKLFVVGDSATLSCHPFYRRLIEYFEGLGAYRTVWEEDDWHDD